MKRAAGTCAEPGCPSPPVYRGRCAEHAQWNAPGNLRTRGRVLMRRRAQIMRAAGHRCQNCGGPPPLELHHRDGDPENDEPANLVPLCRPCHRLAGRA